MRLGETCNDAALQYPRPLDGVRVLALEQLQALPFATQLLARLGADVVKVERPGGGDSGRGALPAMIDESGRPMGATFLRNNLGKRSVAIDLDRPEGRDPRARVARRFDVVAENFRPGVLERMGLGFDAVHNRAPGHLPLHIGLRVRRAVAVSRLAGLCPGARGDERDLRDEAGAGSAPS